jgi:Tfp pilus assembly protein PilF
VNERHAVRQARRRRPKPATRTVGTGRRTDRPTKPAPTANSAPLPSGSTSSLADSPAVGPKRRLPKGFAPVSLREKLGLKRQPVRRGQRVRSPKEEAALRWAPERVDKLVRGKMTLAEFEGISKREQMDIAQIGYDLLMQGRLRHAKLVYEGLVALDPFDAYFHSVLGMIMVQSGHLEEAEARFKRAVHLQARYVSAWASCGEVRVRMGKLEEGMADLARAVSLDPNLRDPAARRAKVLLEVLKKNLPAAENASRTIRENQGSRVGGSGPSEHAGPAARPPVKKSATATAKAAPAKRMVRRRGRKSE